MARMPEYYAEEKARKALERQAKLEAQREAKAQEKMDALPTDEEIKEKVQAQLEREKKFKETVAKKQSLEVLNPSKDVKKKDAKSLSIEGSVKYKQYTKEDKYGKFCVEKEKTQKDGTKVTQNKQNVLKLTEKQKAYYNEQNENVIKYFYREGTIPKYNKYQCTCCGKLLSIAEFHRSYSYANLGKADDVTQFHQSLCKTCSQKLFYYLYYHVHNKDEIAAMEHWCCDTNTYWDKECYLEARRAYDNNMTSNCIVPDYIAAIGRNKKLMGLTYWDSPTIKNRVFTENETLKDVNNNVVGEFKAPLHWNKEEVKLRKKIINTLRYDPFSLYPEEEARNMYYDLDLMIDDTMQEDLLKLKAAVEIVCGLHEIERLRQKQIEMEQNEASESEIKAVVARRNSELQQITKFAQDNGFSERYASKKAKGAGTLTGIMNEMREKQFEDGLVDYYGVLTCKEMQETANMSFKAIFAQIGMSDNEAWGIVQKQTTRIKKLQDELLDAKEALRRKEIELKKAELIYKAKKMKAEMYDEDDEDEIENIIETEEIVDDELNSYLQDIQDEDSDYQEILSEMDGDSDGY